MTRQAQRVYERCLDPVTKKTAYFLNPRTGMSTRKKPKLLRSAEVQNPIVLPEPDRDFSIPCNVCTRRVARKWCVECGDYFCAKDFATAHNKGSSTKHTAMATDVCVQCDSQVASRSCHKCRDEYCDTCYHALHRRGQLSLHTSSWITDSCGACRRFMARQACRCGLSLCKRCAAKDHEVRHGRRWNPSVLVSQSTRVSCVCICGAGTSGARAARPALPASACEGARGESSGPAGVGVALFVEDRAFDRTSLCSGVLWVVLVRFRPCWRRPVWLRRWRRSTSSGCWSSRSGPSTWPPHGCRRCGGASELASR